MNSDDGNAAYQMFGFLISMSALAHLYFGFSVLVERALGWAPHRSGGVSFDARLRRPPPRLCEQILVDTAVDSAVAYANEQWWDDAPYLVEDPWYVQVLEAGIEVARVELDEEVGIEHYAAVPAIGAERLEIQFIEVAMAARGRGVGTRVVRGLAERHPGRRLLAYSEGADGFWASLGWERFRPSEGARSSTARSSFRRHARHAASAAQQYAVPA